MIELQLPAILQFHIKSTVSYTISALRKVHFSSLLSYLLRNTSGISHVQGGVILLRIDLLKRKIEIYQNEKVPGIMSLYNMICFREQGLDCNTLLLTLPSKLIDIVKKIQRGDEESSKIVFKLLFLTPIEEFLGYSDLSDRLWELVKQGKDEEFVSIIKQLVEKNKNDKVIGGGN